MVRILCGVAAVAMLVSALPVAAQINGSTQKPSVTATATQSAHATAPKPAKVKKASPPRASGPRSEASMDCSKHADGKNLHGKELEKFRRACMKNAKKK